MNHLVVVGAEEDDGVLDILVLELGEQTRLNVHVEAESVRP